MSGHLPIKLQNSLSYLGEQAVVIDGMVSFDTVGPLP